MKKDVNLNIFLNEKKTLSSTFWIRKGLKGTVVNQACTSLTRKSLKNTTTVPLSTVYNYKISHKRVPLTKKNYLVCESNL